MRRQRTTALATYVLSFLAGILLFSAQMASGATAQTSSLPFSRDLDETLEAAKASGKPVVLTFVATWCPVCARMKQETFRDPAVLALAEEFLWVMVDIDRNLSVAREYGAKGVPLTYLLDSEGQRRDELLGLHLPADFEDHLTQFLDTLARPPETPSGESHVSEEEHAVSSLTWSPKGYRSLAICFSHVGYGPLNVYSQSPFQALRLGIRPRTPSTLGKGQYEFRGTSTWANVWAKEDAFFLDFEMLQNIVALAYGITDTLEIEVEFQERRRFGGSMDGFIQGFHDVFGINQDGRDEVPKGQFVLQLNPSDGRPSVALDKGDRGTFSRTLQVSVQHNVTCGAASYPAFSYSGTARVETVNGDFDGGSNLDLGVSVAVSHRLGKFYLYGTLGYAWFGRDDFRGLELEDSQFTALAAFEWRIKPKHAVLIQDLFTEGLIEDFGEFSDPSHELTLGWKWELVPSSILEVGLIENIISFDNSADLGIHLGLSRRF